MITIILVSLILLQNLVLMRRLESAASLSEEDRSSAKAGMVQLQVCLIVLVMLQVSLFLV